MTDSNFLDGFHREVFHCKGHGFSKTYEFGKDTQYQAIENYKRLMRDTHTLPASFVVKHSKSYNPITGIFKARVSITVPDSYALEYFRKTYADEGVRFRDYLKSNRFDELNTLANNVAKWSWRLVCFMDGIASDDEDGYTFSFSQLGLANLKDISQCYGMALAITDILQEKYSYRVIYETTGTDYSIKEMWHRGWGNPYIQFDYPLVEVNKPVLEQW